jgi:two-component system NtrC family response regulator
VAVNCSALAESLLESELFGHERGAFTGAVSSKKGRFELAHGGTLFLDEIGELSSNLQVKLLRVLQEKSFERVGGVRSIAVDIRVIAATNKNLGLEMRAGRFREDLFYRLNVVHIAIPPLRERQEDIRLLVNHFLQKYAGERKSAVPVLGVAQEVDRLFYDYSWPGNIRELENMIERVMILCPNEIITGDDLPRGFKSSLDNALHIDGIPANAKLYETLEMVERTMIQRALKMADNVQSHAAAILGIGKSGLNQKIKKYNLEVGAKS